MPKTRVIYANYNPNLKGVTHVAINALEQPPFVFSTYRVVTESDLPSLPKDIPILSIEAARALFEFKEGKLAELVVVSKGKSKGCGSYKYTEIEGYQ